jgi:uncharacterized protein (TIGR03437 family)
MANLSSSRKIFVILALAALVIGVLAALSLTRLAPVNAAARERVQQAHQKLQVLRERKEKQARNAAIKPMPAPEQEKGLGSGREREREREGKKGRTASPLELEYPGLPSAENLYDAPREAADFFKRKRLPEGVKDLPLEKYFEAQEQMSKMEVYSTARARFLNEGLSAAAPLDERAVSPEQSTWAPLGPGNIGGRTRGLVINPQDPNVMYAAGVSGGVWKTTNGGQAWTPIGDKLANITVSSLVLDPTNPNVIYVGTGEGVSVFEQDTGGDFRGVGIFKSADGGANFTLLESTKNQNFHFVNDLVISPSNNQRLYAGTRAGVFRSIDGGSTWVRVLNPRNEDGDPVLGGCLDLAIRTDRTNADVVFAACGSFEQATVYRTTNGASDEAWTSVLTEVDMGRTVLAIAPSNQNIIYAVTSAFENGPYQFALHAVFRSTSGGDPGTWTAQTRNNSSNKLNRAILSYGIFAFATDCGIDLFDDFTGQAWYNIAIAVDPTDPNRVWAGAIDLYRSDDGGVNWGQATHVYLERENPQFIHTDQHGLVFHPQFDGTGNQILYAINDGGIWRTENARAAVATGNTAACKASNTAVNWRSLNNGYGVTQFYHGAVLPDGKSYFGGTQDNGTVLGTDQSGGNAWREIFGGDGGYVAVDPSRPNVLYAENYFISTQKSTDGGATFSSSRFGIADGGLFITPFVMDPSDPNRLWTGGAYLWRTTNAASQWTRGSAITPGLGDVSAIAIAPTDANYVIAGLSDGFIARTSIGLTSNAATNWANNQPRRGFVSSLTFDPINKNIVYATYSTFGGSHVWRSQDGGQTWTTLDGSGTGALPDVPAHSLVIDPSNTSRLYLGTDVGVFVSNDGGANWAVENTGFPNVITETLKLHVVNGETWLYAFTHGRGAWRVRLNSSGCDYALSPASIETDASGAMRTINVIAQPVGCAWTVTSNASWLQATGGSSGNGTVTLNVSANTSITPRTGTVTIAGRSLAVTQPGVPDLAPPTVTVTEPNPNTTITDMLGSITVRGTASDNGAVAAVTWSNDRGGSGTATGTTAWSISALPLASGLNTITITARDTAGNLARTSFRAISRPASLILTAVGTGSSSAQGDGGLAGQASLGQPSALAFDAQGNLYIAETFNDRVRKVNASDGKISTVAGGNGTGAKGDGGPATAAQLHCPTGVALDAQGNLYIADRDNHRVRRVAAADGLITTVAGTGTAGFGGDGGDAKEARLDTPYTVAVDRQGNLYVSDTGNNRVRKVNASDSKINTVAGTGETGSAGDGGPATAAQLNEPEQVAFDAQGNFYIADTFNNRIRKVNASDGIITTIAGTGVRGATGDGGDAKLARIGLPEGLWIDAEGNIFIADTFNDRIRKITTDGKINTVAGNGLNGYSGDGVAATGTRLNCPTGVITDATGKIFIADRDNHRVRVVQNVPTNDNTAPVIALTGPITGASHTTSTSPLTLNGTASDANGILLVQWVNDRGFSGTAAGTNAWAATSIPLLIGLNNVTVTAYDLSGNAGSVRIAVTFNPQQIVLTLAGVGITGSSGDGGAAVAAQLWAPRAVAVDAQGNVYIADTQNHRVRKVAPSGVITAFAGNGILGSSGDGGPAIDANLNEPRGLLVDSAGNVYISDFQNQRVRKVTPDGKISTVAGTGINGTKGDGDLATKAELGFPVGLALDTQANLYIAENGGNRVRKVNASDSKISTVAGNGEYGFSGDGGLATAARFTGPTGIAVDRSGNLYIVDQGNSRLRKVNASDGRISTIAGTGESGYNGDNIQANTAQLNVPRLITLDSAGDLYLAEVGSSRIRKITLSTGVITTVAGSGVTGFGGDNGAPATALLNAPQDIAVDAQGNLYIADGGNNRVRKVQTANSIRTIASISSASFQPDLASEAIAAAFGTGLAATTQIANTLPLPTTLAGTTLRVRDSQGVERYAALFFVSPSQINYLVPAGTANGLATVTVNTSDGNLIIGTVNISTVAPGLYSANADGQGVAAAVALRIKANGEQSYEAVARFDTTMNRYVTVPLDLGPEGEQVFLVLFGSGLRGRTALNNASIKVGGVEAELQFIGAQGSPGLDQVNLRLPRSLAGRGDVDLSLTVDGKNANTVRLNIK